jgi:hypothetical protein
MHSRAIHDNIVERVIHEDDVRTFRISTNTLGAGHKEAVSNDELLRIRDSQPATYSAIKRCRYGQPSMNRRSRHSD